MDTHRSVFSSGHQDQFLGLGNSKKRTYKKELKDDYGDGWRDVWKGMKATYGASNLRGLIRKGVGINTSSTNGNPSINLPSGVSTSAAAPQDETTGSSGVIIALVVLVAIGLGIFIYRKLRK